MTTRAGLFVISMLSLFAMSCTSTPAGPSVEQDAPRLSGVDDDWVDVSLQLRTVSGNPSVGGHLVVELDIKNATAHTLVYDPQSIRPIFGLEMLGPDGKSIPFVGARSQTFGELHAIGPKSVAKTVATVDLGAEFLAITPGTYRVRYNGRGLWIIKLNEIKSLVHGYREQPFGRPSDPVLVSEWIEIALGEGKVPKRLEIVKQLLDVVPPGWYVSLLTDPTAGTVEIECARKASLKDQVVSFRVLVDDGSSTTSGDLLGTCRWGRVQIVHASNSPERAWNNYRSRIGTALGVK
jgi:hypothetical protein